ncbi:hypothetical protein [Ectopseudomonas toyotomiensis]|uniref:GreAB-C-like domain-containing protein n=1 Tax=Ectopseudomonas toyotomiensis TaxID=554344 RepID=A0AA42LKC0_9GAMM|nr:hypothetical protein [Pseudomonas toyotomiensis]MBG0840963.1 hypothetical protein [Pseudomonas toyotomiensis]MDH0704449.1 hypothetical protein [Pseudomonas toyotomiensis]
MAEDDLRVRVRYALAVFPALMRESIMNDESFAHHASLISTQNITLHKAGVSFQRGSFYSGIRDALALSDNVSTITDDAGQDWLVSIENNAGQRYTRLKSNDRVIHLPDFWALSPDSNTRMKEFEREVCELNFIGRRSQEFRDLLERGPLDEDQFDLLNLEFDATPVKVAASIRHSIGSGGSSIEELVPGNRNYFERLVGILQANDTLYLYANNSAREHVDQLFSWDHDKGIKCALLMSSHSLIVANIDIKLLSAEVVEAAFDWVLKSGDFISKLGAVELGLRNLDLFPQLEPYVESIIRQVILDDPDDESGRFSLLSALVVMVSGEVARLNILSGSSPFWVRLAVIAHASLIEREIISSSLSTKEIVSWCLQARGNFYYWKSLLELRVEPRWQPDFISSSQIRFEFLGRISSACAENLEKIKTESLRQLLLGEGGKRFTGISIYISSWPFRGGSCARRRDASRNIFCSTAGVRAKEY